MADLRRNPRVVEAELLPSPEPHVIVILVPDGYRVGPEIRQDVLDAAGTVAVPLTVVPTTAMPRRPDGGLDVAAAETLYRTSGYTFTYRAPASAEEEQVLRMVSDLIDGAGVTISVTDDLASLGGDSLTALELSERIHTRFGVEVPAADLYGARSLADIAATVRNAKA
jgi:acyl carrier protein